MENISAAETGEGWCPAHCAAQTHAMHITITTLCCLGVPFSLSFFSVRTPMRPPIAVDDWGPVSRTDRPTVVDCEPAQQIPPSTGPINCCCAQVVKKYSDPRALCRPNWICRISSGELLYSFSSRAIHLHNKHIVCKIWEWGEGICVRLRWNWFSDGVPFPGDFVAEGGGAVGAFKLVILFLNHTGNVSCTCYTNACKLRKLLLRR